MKNKKNTKKICILFFFYIITKHQSAGAHKNKPG